MTWLSAGFTSIRRFSYQPILMFFPCFCLRRSADPSIFGTGNENGLSQAECCGMLGSLGTAQNQALTGRRHKGHVGGQTPFIQNCLLVFDLINIAGPGVEEFDFSCRSFLKYLWRVFGMEDHKGKKGVVWRRSQERTGEVTKVDSSAPPPPLLLPLIHQLSH